MSASDTKNRLTFNKGERLKSRKTIQSLFDGNSSLKIYPFKLVWLSEPNPNEFSLKIGVSVSKRLFKTAVDRNCIKRKMRECIRLNKADLYSKASEKKINLSIMFIYIGPEIVLYKEFDTKIKLLFNRLTESIKK